MSETVSEILHSVEKLHPQDGDLYLIRVPKDYDHAQETRDFEVIEELRTALGVDFYVLFLIGGLEEPQKYKFEQLDDEEMHKMGWMRIPKEAQEAS